MKLTYSKLNSVKFALAGGIITALIIFITTIGGIYNYCSDCTKLIEGIYGPLGYSITLTGSIIGTTYAFIDGFALTWIFAFIYNKLI